MKTKNRTMHTPGPWVLSEGRAFDSVKDSKGRQICSDYTETTGNWEADSRLIASAPDLLSVAKKIAASHVDGSYIAAGGWWEELLAAIVKAEGC